MKVEIWSDIACPWCFIGKRRFESALATFPQRDEVEIRWHSYQLDAGEGLDYDFAALKVADSLPGHRLLHLAARHDVATEVTEALLSAHFETGQDIADPEVLVAIGAAHDLPADAVRAALADPQIDAEIEADFAQARAYGITGVPFFVLNEQYGVSGAQPSEVFADALEQAWREAHPLVVSQQVGPSCGPDGC